MGEALAAGSAYELVATDMRALAFGFSTSTAYTCFTISALAERMVLCGTWGAHSRLVCWCDLYSEWLAGCDLCSESLAAQVDYCFERVIDIDVWL